MTKEKKVLFSSWWTYKFKQRNEFLSSVSSGSKPESKSSFRDQEKHDGNFKTVQWLNEAADRSAALCFSSSSRLLRELRGTSDESLNISILIRDSCWRIDGVKLKSWSSISWTRAAFMFPFTSTCQLRDHIPEKPVISWRITKNNLHPSVRSSLHPSLPLHACRSLQQPSAASSHFLSSAGFPVYIPVFYEIADNWKVLFERMKKRWVGRLLFPSWRRSHGESWCPPEMWVMSTWSFCLMCRTFRSFLSWIRQSRFWWRQMFWHQPSSVFNGGDVLLFFSFIFFGLTGPAEASSSCPVLNLEWMFYLD